MVATIRLLTRLQFPRPAAAPRRAARASARRRAAVALAVGGAVAVALHLGLAAAGEAALWVRDPVYADKEVRLGKVEGGAPVVVFLGTSRAAYGFAAGMVPEATGGRIEAFNFGVPATGPVTHLVYLRRLLAAGHRPGLLVVEVHPPALADLGGGTLEGRFADGNRLRAEEVEAVLGYGFPADRIRDQRRHSLVAPWHSFRFYLLGRVAPTSLPWGVRFDWGRVPDPRGWYAPLDEDVPPERKAAGFAKAKDEYADVVNWYAPGGHALRALRDLLALARDQGIPVRIVLMPEAAAFRALYARHYTRRLDRVLRDVSNEFGSPLADARRWVPDDGFADGHHLTRKGAVRFTDRLTREVIVPALKPPGGTP